MSSDAIKDFLNQVSQAIAEAEAEQRRTSIEEASGAEEIPPINLDDDLGGMYGTKPPETPEDVSSTLRIRVNRPGGEITDETTDAAFVAYRSEDGTPHVRVLGDKYDLTVAGALLLFVVADNWGAPEIPGFLEDIQRMASDLYAQHVTAGDLVDRLDV